MTLPVGTSSGIRVAAHLDDVEPPVRVVADGDRVGDQRLDRDRLELEARVELERLQGLGRLVGRDAGQLLEVIVLLPADDGHCGQDREGTNQQGGEPGTMTHGGVLGTAGGYGRVERRF